MGFVDEFKQFALKGNVIDMAVGIIIGAAFNKIVQSLVNDLIMPPIGMLLGGVDFKNLQVLLKPGVAAVKDPTTGKEITAAIPEVAVRWGLFCNTVIEFLIVALSVFVMVKVANHLMNIRLRDTLNVVGERVNKTTDVIR